MFWFPVSACRNLEAGFINWIAAQPAAITQIPEQIFGITDYVVRILGAKADGIELRHRASFAESFCKRPAFIPRAFLTRRGVHECGHVSIPIVTGEVRGVRHRTALSGRSHFHGQHAAHTARPLERTAQVYATQEAHHHPIRVIENGEQDLTVPNVTIRERRKITCSVVSGGNALNPPAIRQMRPLLLHLRTSSQRAPALNRDPPVLTVPHVRPQAVARQIPVRVIREALRRFRQQKFPNGVRHDVRAGVVAQRRHIRDRQPHRAGAVVERHLATEIIPLARRARVEIRALRTPQAHRGGICGRAQHVHITRHGALRVLVHKENMRADRGRTRVPHCLPSCFLSAGFLRLCLINNLHLSVL